MRSAEISPTARALQALELLQRTPGGTADQLAHRLGVTDRAAALGLREVTAAVADRMAAAVGAGAW